MEALEILRRKEEFNVAAVTADLHLKRAKLRFLEEHRRGIAPNAQGKRVANVAINRFRFKEICRRAPGTSRVTSGVDFAHGTKCTSLLS
jgi:hypothetical protein